MRNLLIISKAPGSGVLSASLVTDGRDELTGVTGYAIKFDGSEGAPLTVTLSNTVSIANRRPDRADRPGRRSGCTARTWRPGGRPA